MQVFALYVPSSGLVCVPVKLHQTAFVMMPDSGVPAAMTSSTAVMTWLTDWFIDFVLLPSSLSKLELKEDVCSFAIGI